MCSSDLGDAVVETGQFHEALNLISLWKLPILIVIEDNGYSTYANKKVRQSSNLKLQEIVKGFGLSFTELSGDSALHVKNVSFDLVKTVREQNPQVVKFDTFRVFEHCGPNIDDNLGYRSKEEIIS